MFETFDADFTPWGTAIIYAELGIPVLPLHNPVSHGNTLHCSCDNPRCNSPAKHPMTRNGLHDASTDAAVIAAWEKQWPKANIGIVTGAISGLVVLDIDPRSGGDVSLMNIERQYGMMPTTWRFKTGGGGEHILFRHPGGKLQNSTSKIAPGVDVKGDGGYIVAPPSQHISGRFYIPPEQPLADIPLADMPAWMLDITKKPEDGRSSMSTEQWIGLVRGVREGQRHNSLVKLIGKLLSSRLDVYLAFELCLAWNEARCAPPLPREEVEKAFDDIAELRLQELRRKEQ